eukprot:507199-Pelagomonas_calceolata.AAC.1
MYASQIWATPYLRQGKEMDNHIKKWLQTVLSKTLATPEAFGGCAAYRATPYAGLKHAWAK